MRRALGVADLVPMRVIMAVLVLMLVPVVLVSGFPLGMYVDCSHVHAEMDTADALSLLAVKVQVMIFKW